MPAKRLVIDLATVPGVPGKIEGLALAGPNLLAVINDNEFGRQIRLIVRGRLVGQRQHIAGQSCEDETMRWTRHEAPRRAYVQPVCALRLSRGYERARPSHRVPLP